MRLARRALLLLVNLDQPVILTILVLALVAPLGNPLALGLVVDQVAVALLLLDALLGGKLFPFGGLLGGGNRLLTRERCGWRGKDQMYAFRGGLYLAGRQELVDECLGGIAGCGFKRFFVGAGGNGVGVICEQVSQVKCKRCGLVDGNRSSSGEQIVGLQEGKMHSLQSA